MATTPADPWVALSTKIQASTKRAVKRTAVDDDVSIQSLVDRALRVYLDLLNGNGTGNDPMNPIYRVLVTLFVAATAMLVHASAAAAQDPSRVGRNVENIVRPNVQSFWVVALLVGMVVFAFSRKYNLLGMYVVAMAFIGAIIYDTAGFADIVENIGERLW